MRDRREGRSVFISLTVEENRTLDHRRNLGRRGVAAGLERVMYDGAAADLGDVVERLLPTSPS
jgi:hypothetical protein